MRRLFWVAFGAAGGVAAARQLRRSAAELAPTNVIGKAWREAREFWADVRDVAADREDELRASFGLDDPSDVPDGGSHGAAGRD